MPARCRVCGSKVVVSSLYSALGYFAPVLAFLIALWLDAGPVISMNVLVVVLLLAAGAVWLWAPLVPVGARK